MHADSRYKGIKTLINKVLVTSGNVTREQQDALLNAMKELSYLENVCLRHLLHGTSYATVAKMLEVPVSYVKQQERKAIRHLRTPRRYYSILMGEKAYEESLKHHEGMIPVSCCGFSTRTANTLKKNGFLFIEELWKFIGNVPERFTYIDGLGKYGMSEVMFYFYDKEVLKDG